MTDHLSLARTALRLRLTYHQVRSMLLRGELRGGQDENGRFYVESAAVEQYLSEQAPTALKARQAARRAGGRR